MKKILRKYGLKAGALCLAGLAAASFVSRPRSIGSGTGQLLAGAETPTAVLALIDRACRDCHSEATRYPWYSYIAPVSFLVRSDIEEGRKHLNLSRWHELSPQRRARALSEIANQVQTREMPLAIYVRMHPEAKLSDAEIEKLFEWTQEERARVMAAMAP